MLIDVFGFIFKGLYYTGNVSAELAAEWVFENIDHPELNDPFQVSNHCIIWWEQQIGRNILGDLGGKNLTGFAKFWACLYLLEKLNQYFLLFTISVEPV